MLRQTLPPERWIIVDDGSTDRTAEIVKSYQKRVSWIELLQRPLRLERSFAGKVYAFNEGLDRVASLSFDVIGNLDGDLSFDPEYLEFLIGNLLKIQSSVWLERHLRRRLRFRQRQL